MTLDVPKFLLYNGATWQTRLSGQIGDTRQGEGQQDENKTLDEKVLQENENNQEEGEHWSVAL